MGAVTNQEFLAAVFGAAADDAHVCSFVEDPGTLMRLGLGSRWAGGKWGRVGDAERALFVDQNSYFCVSTFADEADTGRARRTKGLFAACFAIVVDDVGPRVVDTGRLSPPSWRLETSAGNEQWGYRLAAPERDAGRVTACLDGMVAAGLAADGRDPGMKGVTRYVRLPGGRNTKAAAGPGGWQCVLREWAPARVFDLDALAAPFGITLPAAGARGGAAGGAGRPAAAAGARDDILDWLDRWGMVAGGRTGDGGWHIRCPWIAEHSADAADTGTAYWVGGGMRCWHGHCGDRTRRELAAWVDARIASESGGLAGLNEFFGPGDRVPGYRAPPRSGPSIEPPPGDAPGDAGEIAGGTGQGTAGQDTGTGTGTGTSPTAGGAGAGAAADAAFFDELVFVAAEDRFLSIASGELLSRAAVDTLWGRELAAVLPVLSARTGATVTPAAWFADGDNRARARMADRMTYWPSRPVWFREQDVRLVNTWRGVEPLGLGRVTDAEVREWLRLVRWVCGREGAWVADVVLDWMAWIVAQPGRKPGWHVVIRGGQGLGKDLMAQPMICGVGPANVATVNARALGGMFNPWAERRLCIVNELKQNASGTATGTDQYNVLKELTETSADWIKINQKNRREYYARNVCAFYVTSNDDRAIALEDDDRRFLVVSAGTAADTAPWPKAEYVALAAWMKDAGGAQLAAEWLRQRWDAMPADRRAVVAGTAPGTAGKAAMVAATEDPVVAWMREEITLGRWPDLMTSGDVNTALAAAARSGAAGFRFAPSPHRWGAALRVLGGDKVYRGEPVRLKSGERSRVWATRDADRFRFMGEPQLAQAYISAAGHAFAAGEVVVLAKPADKTAKT